MLKYTGVTRDPYATYDRSDGVLLNVQQFRPHQRTRPSLPQPKIETNNQASALVALAASDSAGGLIPSTAPAGDALLTPMQPITAAINVGMEGGSGVVIATSTTQLTTDVPSM